MLKLQRSNASAWVSQARGTGKKNSKKDDDSSSTSSNSTTSLRNENYPPLKNEPSHRNNKSHGIVRKEHFKGPELVSRPYKEDLTPSMTLKLPSESLQSNKKLPEQSSKIEHVAHSSSQSNSNAMYSVSASSSVNSDLMSQSSSKDNLSVRTASPAANVKHEQPPNIASMYPCYPGINLPHYPQSFPVPAVYSYPPGYMYPQPYPAYFANPPVTYMPPTVGYPAPIPPGYSIPPTYPNMVPNMPIDKAKTLSEENTMLRLPSAHVNAQLSDDRCEAQCQNKCTKHITDNSGKLDKF